MKEGLFQFHTKASEGVRNLLEDTTLGSNGAKYQLLDTKDKIDDLDHPLFLTLQRTDKVLGNVTFCRRNNHWYIRYFAFKQQIQSDGKKKSKSKKSRLKNELKSFFESSLENGFDTEHVHSFYAYIEPKNVKSLWMTEQFGFKKIGEKVSQTFSRYSPKEKVDIKYSSDWSIVPENIKNHFRRMNYFFEDVFFQGEFTYVLDENGEFSAFCKTSIANWKIEKLPGKLGGMLVKMIPFIPVLNRLIKPKKHTFIIPEAVWVKENDSNVLSSFFESILAEKKLNLIIWWVDVKDVLFKESVKKVIWGLVHEITGNSPVFVVAKSNDFSFFNESQPIYSAGMDSF